MKHILNDLTEQEKNAIREQHTGGMKIINEKFSKLLNSKLGDAKPLIAEQQSVEMEKDTQYIGTSTKDGQTYRLNTGAARRVTADVDVYNPQGVKISDGLLMSVGPNDGIPKGCWGFSNLPDMRKKYGDFKNVKKVGY